ncbi:HDOD domain-containing protein [Christensenellaceae bacterium OttesenSCG-928-K19]|nr:HDOD domain-containing protein [Christensenellaceae bacterium OttesenSCG-928-K19]
MQTYIVKQPIHDRENNLFGYEILYRENPDVISNESDDTIAASTIESILPRLSDTNFFENKNIFITFTEALLHKDIPSIFPSDHLIIQLDYEVLLNTEALELIKDYKKKGYRIALMEFQFSPRYIAMLDDVDIIKLNMKIPSSSNESVASIAAEFGIKVVGFNVDKKESFEYAKKLNVDYMQGQYIGTMVPEKVTNPDHLQSNFFQLMAAVTAKDPDLDQIEELLSRDVTLTYSLLKLVNSAFFGFRNKIQSVHQAMVVLGVNQLRQWIYLLSFRSDENAPEEFIKMSFMRGQFCSELYDYAKDMPIVKSEAYLLGMFSTMDYILGVPMEDALAQLSISDDIKIALLTQEGRCGTLYKMVLAYERGDWPEINECAEELGMPTDVITEKYFECLDSVNNIWSGLMA